MDSYNSPANVQYSTFTKSTSATSTEKSSSSSPPSPSKHFKDLLMSSKDITANVVSSFVNFVASPVKLPTSIPIAPSSTIAFDVSAPLPALMPASPSSLSSKTTVVANTTVEMAPNDKNMLMMNGSGSQFLQPIKTEAEEASSNTSKGLSYFNSRNNNDSEGDDDEIVIVKKKHPHTAASILSSVSDEQTLKLQSALIDLELTPKASSKPSSPYFKPVPLASLSFRPNLTIANDAPTAADIFSPSNLKELSRKSAKTSDITHQQMEYLISPEKYVDVVQNSSTQNSISSTLDSAIPTATEKIVNTENIPASLLLSPRRNSYSSSLMALPSPTLATKYAQNETLTTSDTPNRMENPIMNVSSQLHDIPPFKNPIMTYSTGQTSKQTLPTFAIDSMNASQFSFSPGETRKSITQSQRINAQPISSIESMSTTTPHDMTSHQSVNLSKNSQLEKRNNLINSSNITSTENAMMKMTLTEPLHLHVPNTMTEIAEPPVDITESVSSHVCEYQKQDLDELRESLTSQFKTEQSLLLSELVQLEDKYHTSLSMIDSLKQIIGQYESTMLKLTTEAKTIKSDYSGKIESLITAKKQSDFELDNLHLSFNDLRKRYDDSRTQVETLERSNAQLAATVSALQSDIQTSEARLSAVTSHAQSKLDAAAADLARSKSAFDFEISATRARATKAELHVSSLEKSLDTKIKENEELMKICDGLIQQLDSGSRAGGVAI